MAEQSPGAELDPRYSSERPTPWARARRKLHKVKSYWLSTVRPDARPHVTTIGAVWLDDALHVTTGRDESKVKNLARNSRCIIGCHVFQGLDVVVEGGAARVTGAAAPREVCSALSLRGAWPRSVPSGHCRPGSSRTDSVRRVPFTAVMR